MAVNYQLSEALRTIPRSKLSHIEQEIISVCKQCCGAKKVSCDTCGLKMKVLDRYFQSNIPIDFWKKAMDTFKGDEKAIKIFNEYTKNITDTYNNGVSLCLYGNHGTGKTYFSSAILKRAVEKGYTALYTTLSDMVNVLIYSDQKTKVESRRELLMTEFLVIDEFDYRFMGNDNSAELFGRILEGILRIRLQNKMPTFLISNSPDPTKLLGDNLSASIGSLISGYMQAICFLGEDFRKKKGING